MSKHIPILFSTAMVQAKLAGRKTMTRRIVKGTALEWLNDGFTPDFVASEGNHLCPYGQPGDVLWTRETWLKFDRDHVITSAYAYKANGDSDTEELRRDYIKSGRDYKWKPSIHMPKAACRMWDKVKAVRVERLQDITEEDARAEGVFNAYPAWHGTENESTYEARLFFKKLWIDINGAESWEANPWVWVVEFEPCEMPEDFLTRGKK